LTDLERQPEDIPALDPESIPNEPDPKTSAEAAYLDKEHKKAALLNIKQDIELRRDYARDVFKLIVFWLAFVGLIVLLQGFKLLGYILADSVMIALITTTTASVIGILLIVVRYLFPNR
jgi:hypothetical protein